MLRLLWSFILLAITITLPANSLARTVEQIGDYFSVIVPAYALGMSAHEQDWTGFRQFTLSYLGAQATVEILKSIVTEKRPNGGDKSFPSGHAASAFSGAAFVHKRYGIQRAILPYLMAGFTAYSRVYSDKHYWHDVAASAAISSLFTYFLVSKEHTDDAIQILASPRSVFFGYLFAF